MTKNQPEALRDMIQTNLVLIPAVLPDISDSPHVISEQPRSNSAINDGPELKQSINYYNRRHQHQPTNNPEGLARLAGAEEVVISLEKSCSQCVSGSKYFINDASKGEESFLFKAAQGPIFWDFGDLKNVVIRDREDVPVARVCFKEKHLILDSLVLAVYAPPELLIGTVEESPSCFVFSSEFMLGNADGDHLFRINYDRGLCKSKFFVTSLQNPDDSNEQIVHILEKSSESMRVKFFSRMSISSKLILVGFCVGVIQNRMSQEFTSI